MTAPYEKQEFVAQAIKEAFENNNTKKLERFFNTLQVLVLIKLAKLLFAAASKELAMNTPDVARALGCSKQYAHKYISLVMFVDELNLYMNKRTERVYCKEGRF